MIYARYAFSLFCIRFIANLPDILVQTNEQVDLLRFRHITFKLDPVFQHFELNSSVATTHISSSIH